MNYGSSTYGVSTARLGYIDVSRTERGAKNFATRHGDTEVYRRSSLGDFSVFLSSTKVNGKWVQS